MPTICAGRALALPLLVVALVVAVAAPAQAQIPAPPHRFVGNVDEIRVNGLPYDGVTPIEAIDGTDAVLVIAIFTDGLWIADVPSGNIVEVRFRIGTAISATLPVSAGFINDGSPSLALTLTGPEPQPQRTLALLAGTNALTYSGEAGASPAVVRDGLANPAALDTIYQWDALSQSWLSWRFTDLAFLNTLTSLGSNQPLFLTLSQSTTYAGPLLAYEAGARALTAGFTTIAFLGENGTSLETALAQIAFPPAIDVIFRYSNLTQTYQTYRRTGPAFLNDLLTLNRFDVLFVKTSTPTAWTFDAFQP